MFELYHKNCFELLDELIEKKILVDLILIDPPYYISRKTNFSSGGDKNKYGNLSMDFGEWDKNEEDLDFAVLLDKLNQILKKGGTLIIFYDIFKMQTIYDTATSLKFKQPRIGFWDKTNAVPINAKINYLSNAREYFISFCKDKKNVFNSYYDKGVYQYPIVGGKEKTSHPTQKPINLISDLIKTHSNEGDLVADFFMGSGTTGVACKLNNRQFIGCELNEDYFNIAKRRISSLEV